mmetsp:Transcript_76593/g.217079  ORF Transcript_76593/g.217079 Transcript_76593/m.217079 type:complete len:387 (-) Transcript_76593:730-1890(-)
MGRLRGSLLHVLRCHLGRLHFRQQPDRPPRRRDRGAGRVQLWSLPGVHPVVRAGHRWGHLRAGGGLDAAEVAGAGACRAGVRGLPAAGALRRDPAAAEEGNDRRWLLRLPHRDVRWSGCGGCCGLFCAVPDELLLAVELSYSRDLPEASEDGESFGGLGRRALSGDCPSVRDLPGQLQVRRCCGTVPVLAPGHARKGIPCDLRRSRVHLLAEDEPPDDHLRTCVRHAGRVPDRHRVRLVSGAGGPPCRWPAALAGAAGAAAPDWGHGLHPPVPCASGLPSGAQRPGGSEGAACIPLAPPRPARAAGSCLPRRGVELLGALEQAVRVGEVLRRPVVRLLLARAGATEQAGGAHRRQIRGVQVAQEEHAARRPRPLLVGLRLPDHGHR